MERVIAARFTLAAAFVLAEDLSSAATFVLVADRVAATDFDSAATPALAAENTGCARLVSDARLGLAVENETSRALIEASVAAEVLDDASILRACLMTVAALGEEADRTTVAARVSSAVDADAAERVRASGSSRAKVAEALLTAVSVRVTDLATKADPAPPMASVLEASLIADAELDPTAVLAADIDRTTRAVAEEAAARVALVLKVRNPAALLAAVNETSLALIVTSEAALPPAANRVACTKRVTTATPGLVAALVARVCLATAARLGDAAMSVISLDLIAWTLARFIAVATSILRACLTTMATLAEVAARNVLKDLTTSATFGEAAERVDEADLATTATFGDPAARVELTCLTDTATFGEVATLIGLVCFTASATFGDAARRVALLWRTTAATLGLTASLIALGWRTIAATLGPVPTRTGRACLTTTAALGLAAASVIVKSVPVAGKSTRSGSNHAIGISVALSVPKLDTSQLARLPASMMTSWKVHTPAVPGLTISPM